MPKTLYLLLLIINIIITYNRIPAFETSSEEAPNNLQCSNLIEDHNQCSENKNLYNKGKYIITYKYIND